MIYSMQYIHSECVSNNIRDWHGSYFMGICPSAFSDCMVLIPISISYLVFLIDMIRYETLFWKFGSCPNHERVIFNLVVFQDDRLFAGLLCWAQLESNCSDMQTKSRKIMKRKEDIKNNCVFFSVLMLRFGKKDED